MGILPFTHSILFPLFGEVCSFSLLIFLLRSTRMTIFEESFALLLFRTENRRDATDDAWELKVFLLLSGNHAHEPLTRHFRAIRLCAGGVTGRRYLVHSEGNSAKHLLGWREAFWVPLPYAWLPLALRFWRISRNTWNIFSKTRTGNNRLSNVI